MRIYISGPTMKRSLRIHLPYRLAVRLFVRKVFFKCTKNPSTYTQMQDIQTSTVNMNFDSLEEKDFKALRKAMLSVSIYKGLDLVDIESANGTVIKITT